MSGYVFRPATKNDFPSICKLIRNREELLWVYPAGKYPLTVPQLEVLAEKRIELTVAVESDRVVGFADFYDYQPGMTVFIGNVIVDRKCRGRGLGKALIANMLEKAFDVYKLPEVRISVFSDNARALLLYARLGFVPYAMDERLKSDGKRVALIHLRRAR